MLQSLVTVLIFATASASGVGARFERDLDSSAEPYDDILRRALELVPVRDFSDFASSTGSLARTLVLNALANSNGVASDAGWLESFAKRTPSAVSSSSAVSVFLVPPSLNLRVEDVPFEQSLLARAVHAYTTISACIVWYLSVPKESRATWYETHVSASAVSIRNVGQGDPVTGLVSLTSYIAATRVRQALDLSHAHPHLARLLLCDLPGPVSREIVSRLQFKREHSVHLTTAVRLVLEHVTLPIVATSPMALSRVTPGIANRVATIGGSAANTMLHMALRDDSVVFYDKTTSVLLLDLLDQLVEASVIQAGSTINAADIPALENMPALTPKIFNAIIYAMTPQCGEVDFGMARRITYAVSLRWALRLFFAGPVNADLSWLPAPRNVLLSSSMRAYIQKAYSDSQIQTSNAIYQSSDPLTANAVASEPRIAPGADAVFKVAQHLRTLLSWRALVTGCATLADIMPGTVPIRMLGRHEMAYGTSTLSDLESYASDLLSINATVRLMHLNTLSSDSVSLKASVTRALIEHERRSIAMEAKNIKNVAHVLFDRYVSREIALGDLRKAVVGVDHCAAYFGSILPSAEDISRELDLVAGLLPDAPIKDVALSVAHTLRAFRATHNILANIDFSTVNRIPTRRVDLGTILSNVLQIAGKHTSLFVQSLHAPGAYAIMSFPTFASHIRVFNEWASYFLAGKRSLADIAVSVASRCPRNTAAFSRLLVCGSAMPSAVDPLAISLRDYTSATFAHDMWAESTADLANVRYVAASARRFFGRNDTVVGGYGFLAESDFVNALSLQRQEDGIYDYVLRRYGIRPSLRLVSQRVHDMGSIWTIADQQRYTDFVNKGYVVRIRPPGHIGRRKSNSKFGVEFVYALVSDANDAELDGENVMSAEVAEEQEPMNYAERFILSSLLTKRPAQSPSLDAPASKKQDLRTTASISETGIETQPHLRVASGNVPPTVVIQRSRPRKGATSATDRQRPNVSVDMPPLLNGTPPASLVEWDAFISGGTERLSLPFAQPSSTVPPVHTNRPVPRIERECDAATALLDLSQSDK